MTIEFRCTQCDRLLRVPGGTEGKKAKCPECGAILEIPAPASHVPPPREPEFATAPAVRPAEASDNPYQSPTAYAAPQPAPRGFHPTQIAFGATFDRAWRLYKENFGLVAGGGALVFLLMLVIDQVVQRMFGTQPERFVIGFEFRIEDGPRTALQFLALVVSLAVHAVLWLGLIGFMLKIARREEASLVDLFSGGALVLPGMLVHVVTTILILAGGLLCLIPGVWVALTLSLSMFMLVDQRTSVADSFLYSARAMRGNKLVLLGLWLVCFGLLVLVTVSTCGLGSFVFGPFVVLLMTVVYLSATGQLPTADGQPAY